MSEWINHVKQYQAEHGCSYKDALKCAKATYKKGDCDAIEGGKLNMKKVKKVVNKGAKVVKKAAKGLQKNEKFVKMVVGDEYADNIDKAIKVSKKASKIADEIETQTGGSIKDLGRKAKNTVKRVKKVTKKVTKVVDKVAPIASMVAPEVGAELMAVNKAVKKINGGALGSTRKGKQNPYLNGGSFRVAGGSFAVPIRGGCMTCSNPTNSVMISPHHPAFAPKKPKSYSDIIAGN